MERFPLIPPMACVVDDRLRGLDATLDTLPLHAFEGDSEHLIGEVTAVLEHFPKCPGIIVTEQRQFSGMVSRQQLLEWLINPRTNLFEQPLSFLVRMACGQPLILPSDTLILDAANQVLSLTHSQPAEPIVVQVDSNVYRLLSRHDLLKTAWHVREMETRLKLERNHIQMIQTEKMASLGRLVNGVAHEILDPVGFIWGNLCHISDYTQDLIQLIDGYEQQLAPLPPELADLREEIELDYLKDDLPKAIASIQSGADRLKTLAASLQTFCYIDEIYPKPADIHRCLDSIVFLLETQLSGEIEVIRDYGHLPPVTCYIGQLNQVFTNILSNAVQALMTTQGIDSSASSSTTLNPSEQAQSNSADDDKPCIRITTQVCTQHFDDSTDGSKGQSKEGPSPRGQGAQVLSEKIPSGTSASVTGGPSQHRWVSIQIANNGPALSPEQYRQILQLFSAPCSMAKETSLAISHRIVVEKHDGKLLVRSPLSPHDLPRPQPLSEQAFSSLDIQPQATPEEFSAHGTEFQILLPIQ